ncbi:hypothetical protein AB6A40_005769 [Gnathostoma spinigerum]|uniref:DRBM domain-containing protein n=1 Tax=Gnathostoma spinigerum TaxID=75299 RepID=A0ABD6EHK1_9BILA
MLETPPAIVFATANTTNADLKKKSAAFELQPWCGQHITGQEKTSMKNVYNYAQMDEHKEKTPMCRIAELARFNKLKHEYKLMDESGPAHKKRFTVSLILTPDQVFDGCGASIKKAQQAAADAALRATTLPRPPERIPSKKLKKDPRNPLILLSYIAHRLGYEPVFKDIGPSKSTIALHPPFIPPPEQPPSNGFVPLINDCLPSPQLPQYPHICHHPTLPVVVPTLGVISGYGPPPRPSHLIEQRVVQVRLTLGKGAPIFYGRGPTKQKAKISAATQALLFLGPHLETLGKKIKSCDPANCDSGSQSFVDEEKSNGGNNCEVDVSHCDGTVSPISDSSPIIQSVNRNGKPKSAISQVHECALQMRMNVEFEILSEDGPAHDKHYCLRCKMMSGDVVLVADGEGGSKKLAKQNACALMLSKLKSLETSPLLIASTIYKSQKKSSVPREVKRKTIIKDMKMDPEYGHQINPVSRLMQVMQAKKDNEPQFRLIAEHGQSRYKEFVVEVVCGTDLRCEGTGPNKKLAKRAAAEAMLAKIGYVKQMPKPGKSLLKKRSDNTDLSRQEKPVEIGIFNPDDVEKSENAESVEGSDKSAANPISEVTLSVTATIGSHVMTFADVDEAVKADEQRNVRSVSEARNDSSSSLDDSSPQSSDDCPAQHSPSSSHTKRRVTFSNEVSACPAPDDITYPSASVTLLKSEVLFVNKIRRRGRDSKKALSDTQRCLMISMAREFLAGWNPAQNVSYLHCSPETVVDGGQGSGNMEIRSSDIVDKLNQLNISHSNVLAPSTPAVLPNGFWPAPHPGAFGAALPLYAETPRRRLERIAETMKFSVSFSDFPKAREPSEYQYFSLVSLGIEKPVVCHGSGNSEDAAHENAAYNALVAISNYDVQNCETASFSPVEAGF